MGESGNMPDTLVKEYVLIEVFAWLTRYVGGVGGGRMFFTEEFEVGEILQVVLRRLTQRFPDLDAILWDTAGGQLGTSVEIIVNDSFLGITHTLQSQVTTGDMITLLPAWDGG